MILKTIYFTLFFLLNVNASDLETQKVNFLLDQVEKSDVIFLRNGSEHSPKKARAHLKFKYEKAKGFFFVSSEITAQQFIDNIASQSSTTGEKYYVILKNGKKIPTKQWLDEKLKSFAPPKSP